LKTVEDQELIDTMNAAIKRSGKSREQVALDMGYRGVNALERILNPNDYYQLPVPRLVPFCKAVNDFRLLEILCRRAGGHFIPHIPPHEYRGDLFHLIGDAAEDAGLAIRQVVEDAGDDGKLNRAGTREAVEECEEHLEQIKARVKA